MKKKFISIALSLTLVAALFAGCGGKKDDKPTDSKATEAPASNDKDEAKATEAPAALPADTGKVLNIWAWNSNVKDTVFDAGYVPGYTNDGKGGGSFGDVKVKWNITPNANNAYQIALDAALLEQANAPADKKIDMFLIEADYSLKYAGVEPAVAMSMDELGLTDAMKDQYQYTKDIVTDSKGAVRGSCYQAAPGLYVYRRSIAKAVLGTDDPEQVQAKISNWDDFDAVAAQMKAKGYTMLAGYDDAYRPYSYSMKGPWVQDGKIVIDDIMMKYVDKTKEYTEKGYNKKDSLWGATWTKEQTNAGKTFGYFYSTWGINFTLADNSRKDPKKPRGADNNNGVWGDWAVCYGPQAYAWGGTWFMAAVGTDNANLVKQIIFDTTCNKDNMKKFAEESNDYTNNVPAMEEIANSDYKSDFLGGQNHYKLFAEVAKNLKMGPMSPYDQGCNEAFQKATKDYYDGKVTKEKAIENFYKDVLKRYPDIKK